MSKFDLNEVFESLTEKQQVLAKAIVEDIGEIDLMDTISLLKKNPPIDKFFGMYFLLPSGKDKLSKTGFFPTRSLYNSRRELQSLLGKLWQLSNDLDRLSLLKIHVDDFGEGWLTYRVRNPSVKVGVKLFLPQSPSQIETGRMKILLKYLNNEDTDVGLDADYAFPSRFSGFLEMLLFLNNGLNYDEFKKLTRAPRRRRPTKDDAPPSRSSSSQRRPKKRSLSEKESDLPPPPPPPPIDPWVRVGMLRHEGSVDYKDMPLSEAERRKNPVSKRRSNSNTYDKAFIRQQIRYLLKGFGIKYKMKKGIFSFPSDTGATIVLAEKDNHPWVVVRLNSWVSPHVIYGKEEHYEMIEAVREMVEGMDYYLDNPKRSPVLPSVALAGFFGYWIGKSK